MEVLKQAKMDLLALKKEHNLSFIRSIFTNRGWHSLFFYRLSHFFYCNKIPILPLILSRIIQIFYGVDIDYRCEIEGGIIIIHGIGIVIGQGCKIASGTTIYHQVTLGIKGSGRNDGFPRIAANCTLCTGSKLLGNVFVGSNSVIGANVVVTQNIPKNTIIKLKSDMFVQYSRKSKSIMVN